MLALFTSTLGRNILIGAGAVLVTALAVQTVRIEGALCRNVALGEKPDCIIQGFKQRLAVVRIDLDHVRDLRAAEKLGYEQAQKDAKRIAEAEKARIEADFAAERERKNHALSQARSAARVAADRYADANSVHRPCPGTAADSLRAGGSNLPEPADSTVIVNGQTCDSNYIAVSRSDFDILIDNTVKLVNAHEWAMQFKAE